MYRECDNWDQCDSVGGLFFQRRFCFFPRTRVRKIDLLAQSSSPPAVMPVKKSMTVGIYDASAHTFATLAVKHIPESPT